METRRNLFQILGDWWETRQASASHKTVSPSRALTWLGRQLMPNLGSVLLVLILLSVFPGIAAPLGGLNTPGPSATTVNYQGRLADNAGTPLDGNYGMSFALYDAASAGNLVWGPEDHPAVPVSAGLFSVGLGSQTPGGIPTTTWNGDRYLEITVGGETLSPRELIRSVPIAGMALTVPDGAIGTSQIADGAVTSEKMSPTVFQATAGDEIPILASSSTENFVAFSLEVDFPLDANYLIMYKITSMHGVVDRRILTRLRDENFNNIDNTVIHHPHYTAGRSGSITSSASTVHFFPAGTHTINVIAWTTGNTTDAYIRGDSSIIAIPFAVNP